MLFLGRFRLGLLHRNIFLGTNLFNVEAILHLYPLSNNKYNFASKCRDLLQLGIRSLANASRARQFKPPWGGVGQIFIFF